MPRRRSKTKTGPEVEDYRHEDKRTNNPPAGIMGDYGPKSEPSRRKYEYNPHLDPQLVWAGKAEHTSFEVENVPLYIHERISTQAILRAVKREDVNRSLFADPELSLKETVECYRHPMDWANRLILGDSLVVMNSLLERERMAGQVQMIYIDPPYGIGYNSNFQPRTDRRDVKDGADDDLTREPEQISAYRDTWSLGIHSYLTYLRDRLLLAKELLSESGSVFVQISDENVHHVRELMDEVFEADNFVAVVPFRKKTMPLGAKHLESVNDYIIWYARDISGLKYRQLFVQKSVEGDSHWNCVELPDGTRRRMTQEEVSAHKRLPDASEIYQLIALYPAGVNQGGLFPVEFEDRTYRPPPGRSWGTSAEGMARVIACNRIQPYDDGETLRYVLKFSDYPVTPITTLWADTSAPSGIRYVVETNTSVVQRCLLMTTDPGDLVLDPTCGSGTTAYVAEQWGRRWITCDTSRVAMFLARQRLLTAKYDYYALEDEQRGVAGGFKYKTVPHITLKSIANNPELDPEKVEARREAIRKEVASGGNGDSPQRQRQRGTVPVSSTGETPVPRDTEQEVERRLREANEAIIRANADQEVLYDQPEVVRSKVRVSGPFTVEAIPPPSVEASAVGGAACEASGPGPHGADDAPCGPSNDMRDGGPSSTATTEHIETLIEHLRKDGVTFPGGRKMVFASLTGCGSGVIHAEGEPANGNGLKRVAVSFGPLHGSVTEWQVEDGLREAYVGGYDGIIFCGFAFDAEAQAAISQLERPRVRPFMAHIRPDMLMTDEQGHDLLKTTATAQLFTVFGEPEVEVRAVARAPRACRGDDTTAPTREARVAHDYEVELLGVDVYDPLTGTVSATRADRVAAWFVDTDYDGRTFCVCQAFFPDRSAWEKLGRALKGYLDPEKFEMLTGTVSLPFRVGEHGRVAVKVIDRRGNEVMVVRTAGE